jgi:circadian clock protein KaiC
VSDRLASGHEPLDEIIGGGLPANAISLIMGMPGTCKTIIAQQYVFQNASPERPAVYFSTVSEPLEKIVRFGQSLEFFDLAVERTGARRVLIDSLADLRMAAPDETRFREFVYSLTQRFSRQGVSILMTMEIPDLFHLERLSESALSHLSDNVVLLKYVQDDHSIQRAVSVIKSRASYHHPDTRPFLIGRDGIVLTDSLRPRDGR